MSLIPPDGDRPGNIVRMLWRYVPRELSGKVTNLREIEAAFSNPPKKEIELLRAEKKHAIYGFKIGKIGVFVAYDCFSCNKIVFGPPNIVDDMSIRNGVPLTGREGYDIYCNNCHSHLESRTFAVS